MSYSTPGIYLTVAASGSGHVRFLSGLNDVNAGVVSVRARPATRRTGWLSREVLSALGKSFEVAGKGRNAQEDTALVPVWLAAHEVTDLLVAGVEVLSLDHLHHLAALASGLRLRLWLVADHVASEAIHSLAAAWPVTPVPQDRFDAHWSAATNAREPAESPPTGPEAWPAEVPLADFPVFLAEANSRLTPDAAAAVGLRFLEAFSEAGRLLDSVVDDLTEDTASEAIRRMLRGCATRSEMVTVVTAFQAAAFHRRWLVLVDRDSLLSSGSGHLAALASNPQTWVKLRAYRQPYRAAVCALNAADLDLTTLRRLSVGAVSHDGTTLEVAGVAVVVPAGSEVFIRAQLLLRIADGAKSDSPLFASRTGQLLGVRTLAGALDAAARELGLVFSAGLTRTTRTPKQWRQRHGISVQSLEPSKRRVSA